MNIALAYHKGDLDQAVRWMEWVAELGGLGSHQLFTLCSFDCTPIEGILPQIRVEDSEQTPGGDWQSAESARSAAAPNSMLRIFAWKFYMEKLGPWAFIEPDCIPLKAGWIDALEAEYRTGGKPFMGAEVRIDKVPPHLSGNSVMPQDVPSLAPSLIMRTNWINDGKEYELAFDIAGAKEVLPQAHFTNLIQHKFRHPGFKSREEFEATIDPRAVLFHSNKTGDIYKFLRGGFEPGDGTSIGNFGGTAGEWTPIKLRASESATAAPMLVQMDRDTSREALVRDAVAVLKQLCTAPSYIAQVRRELKAQGVTK